MLPEGWCAAIKRPYHLVDIDSRREWPHPYQMVNLT